MNKADKECTVAHLATTIAMMCVRNTKLDDTHAGLAPIIRTAVQGMANSSVFRT